ncbi:hypothetical protein E6C50_01005 [Flavobacterium supellecticarium]|uniref:Uncharacterized protein n=1 Tax=Flavobacterium supellecticarium TaxID=2565924 RepID=A0A4S4A330_9FLAO|nr:hypothetical protein [Flavobacterium supellecticarium]THF52820.1 hypothetical protein E6C50_01005 [Flavobacterium supellecticarium]
MEHTEQDEITPTPEYVKGFNEGYIMAQFSPNFSNDSISNLQESDRNKGFAKGMMQFAVEKKLEKTMSRFTNVDRNPNKDLTKDKGLDKE